MEFLVLFSIAAGLWVTSKVYPNTRVGSAERSVNSYRAGKKRTPGNKGWEKRKAAKQPTSMLDAWRKGWRKGAREAVIKKANGTDFVSRARRFFKVTGKGAAKIHSAGKTVGGELKEGYETVKDASILHYYVNPVRYGTVHWEDDGEELEEKTEQDTTDNTTEGYKRMATTDLETINEYIGELNDMKTSLEIILEPVAQLTEWRDTFGDRFNGAKWGTDGINAANEVITDTDSGGLNTETVETLLEAVENGLKAAEEALRLGEVAAELGAKGDVKAYQAA